MTIQQALNELIESADFKEKARNHASYRVFNHRVRNGKIRETAIVKMLEKFGYKILVKR